MLKKILITSFTLVSIVMGSLYAVDGGEVGNGGENQAVINGGIKTPGQDGKK